MASAGRILEVSSPSVVNEIARIAVAVDGESRYFEQFRSGAESSEVGASVGIHVLIIGIALNEDGNGFPLSFDSVRRDRIARPETAPSPDKKGNS